MFAAARHKVVSEPDESTHFLSDAHIILPSMSVSSCLFLNSDSPTKTLHVLPFHACSMSDSSDST